MMEPDVVADVSGFGETVVGSKGDEELKDELRNSEHNDVRGGKNAEGGEKSVVEGDKVDGGGEVGGGDAERRDESVEAKDGTAREDVDMVETGNVGHAENTSVEGGTEEKVGEVDVERRGESVEAKDETKREDVDMVETGNVGDEEKTSSGGGTEEEVGEEGVERREAKEETAREDAYMVESGNVGHKERTSIAWGKEKGVGEEDVERREESVEAKEDTTRDDSDMVATRIVGRQERTSFEGGGEEEVGGDGDVRREESVEVKDSKREDVGMVEGEHKGNALVGRKEEEGEKVGGENDVRREESVEGKAERKEEDSEMAEVANGEKNVIEGSVEAEGEELDEGNDARREESVEGKGEDLQMAAAGNVENGEKTAIEGGLEAEGEEVGEDNDARREESVEGNEEIKREDVGMAEAQNEEETFIEGGEEDGEEVSEDNNATDEEESEEGEKTDASSEADFSAEKNRVHREKASKKGDTKGEKQSASRGRESPRTPATSLIERPVRERKTVERLVEVIDKEPYKELLLIDKGRGTPLKDIPNVSYKLAKKKPGDLKLLHQTLFGRRGKATNFRNHILQFSGFAWNEDDEKQRAKVKDKLDKYVRDILWDFCDLFDIPFSKTTTRKEDLVLKLLDFMVAPHAITDVIIAGKDEQSQKTKKRKRVPEGTASKNVDGMLAKGLRKKQDKSERTTAVSSKTEETEEEDDEDNKNDYESDRHDEVKPYKHSDSDEFENKIEETFDEQLKNVKRDTSRSSKQQGSATKENLGTYPKTPPVTTLKKSSTTPSSENQMEERNDVEVKVFSRKKKNVDALEKKSSSKPDKKEKPTSYEHHFKESNDVEVKVFSRKKANDDTPKKTLSSKPVKNEKSTGKKLSTGNGKGGSAPSNEELRKTIFEILKEVDFKETTFTDILKLLDTYYKMDLKPKKSTIKLMIQEELTRLADEAIENEDYEDEGAEGFASKNEGRMPVKGSTKKQDGGERTTSKRKRVDKEDNEKVNESGPPEEGRPFMHSDGDQSESEETDEPDNKHLKNGKQDTPRSSKQRGYSRKEKLGTYPKISPVTTMKKASETPPSNDNVKVFSRKKKSVDAHTKSSFKPAKKEKSTGKRLSTGRGKMGSIPSKEELRKTICEILKEIDFNTATFTDMLKQLTTYYKMDLTPKKSAIKLIIQEELSRLAEEVVENEDSVDEEQSDDEDDTQPARKKMKV